MRRSHETVKSNQHRNCIIYHQYKQMSLAETDPPTSDQLVDSQTLQIPEPQTFQQLPEQLLGDMLETCGIEKSLNHRPNFELCDDPELKLVTIQQQHQHDLNSLKLDQSFDKLLMGLTETKIELFRLSYSEFNVYGDQERVSDGFQRDKEDTQSPPDTKMQWFLKKFHMDMKKYEKIIMIRQLQLSSLLYLCEHRHEPNFQSNYLQRYGALDSLIVRPGSCDKQICLLAIQEAMFTEIELLKEFRDTLDRIHANIQHKKYESDLESVTRLLGKTTVLNAKIVTIAETFPSICTLDPTDLFSYPKEHERWQKLLRNHIQYRFYGESEKIKESFLWHKSGINMINATMGVLYRESWLGKQRSWKRIASSSYEILKCAFSSDKAAHESEVLSSEPNGALTKQIWNLPDHQMLRVFVNQLMPSIKFSQQIFIPRVLDQFIDSMEENEAASFPDMAVGDVQKYGQELTHELPHTQRLKMRINSPFPIARRSAGGARQRNWLHGWTSYFAQEPRKPQCVVYHIHGGGFISMSSYIHQTYTRVWSKNLGVPIVSVDYGKAPENPFPEGLYDCFQGYMWLVHCFQQVYKVEPKKIIVVGDSAGGNLAAALTNMLIKQKLRVPDGLVLAYPALNLNLKQYTPSLLNSFSDMILPHTYLKLCAKAYLSNTKNETAAQTDCYISPLAAPNQILQHYPPTRIFVGGKDPFHDDCCRFTEKLNEAKNNNAKLMIFNDFPHAFLQFDFKTQPHEQCRRATGEVESGLRELIEKL